MKKLKPKKGRILISEPNMSDDNFKLAVLIIARHNEQESIGFIINKKTEFTINDVVEHFPKINANIYIGGPVERNRLYFIHSLGNQIKNSIKISENLYWSGDFETLKNQIEEGKVKANQIRFFAGYSGWSAGQLEQELDSETWIVANSDTISLDSNEKNMWRNCMKKLEKDYAIWSNMNKDFNLN